jgi:hypothetical protein
MKSAIPSRVIVGHQESVLGDLEDAAMSRGNGPREAPEAQGRQSRVEAEPGHLKYALAKGEWTIEKRCHKIESDRMADEPAFGTADGSTAPILLIH